MTNAQLIVKTLEAFGVDTVFGQPGAHSAAIYDAAKVAQPQRQVVCATGDGAFMMTCAELATAVQERIAVPVIVVNDGQLGAIKGIQERQYRGRYIAVDLLNPDFGKLAESFGMSHARVETVGAFEPALRSALGGDGPTLVEVVKQGIG